MNEKITVIVDDLLAHNLTRDDTIKKLKILFSTSNNETNQNEALNAAVTALYFNDSSDYLAALYKVTKHLTNVDTGKLLLDDIQIKEMFKQLNPND